MFLMSSYHIKWITAAVAVFFLSACGGPPDDIVRLAIIDSIHAKAFSVSKWNNVNSYERKENGEDVQYIEYEATLKIKPEYEKYVNSGGGISFPSAIVERNGTVGLIKRGDKWYLSR